jgi:pentafunctional AROM polypeptide
MIGTVPASAVLDDVEASSSGDIISLTNNVSDHRDGPAMVVDMAYRPAETPLLGLARKIAEEHWSTVTRCEHFEERKKISIDFTGNLWIYYRDRRRFKKTPTRDFESQIV